MIKEICIDNFHCLSGFRIEPDPVQLWLGDNGSGKTSVLKALRKIQRLLNGEHIEDIFKKSSLTSWEQRLEQDYSIKIDIDDEIYEYELKIEYHERENTARIKKECLEWKDSTFFLFDGYDAHLYREDSKTGKVIEGTSFSADWRRSIIPTIAERADNKPLLRFREEIGKWMIVQPVPPMFKQMADSETRALSQYAENFAQWYRHLLQEYPGIADKCRKNADLESPPDSLIQACKEFKRIREVL